MRGQEEPAVARYDYETDTFSARPQKRDYESSYQVGDIIFDLDTRNEIRGVEILDASKVFNIPKYYLKNSISGSLHIQVKDDTIKMELIITSKMRNSERSKTLDLERPKPAFLAQSEMRLAVS